MSTAGRCSSCAATEQSPNRLLDVCRKLVLIQKFGFETIPTQRKPTVGKLDLPFQVVELCCPTMADFLILYNTSESSCGQDSAFAGGGSALCIASLSHVTTLSGISPHGVLLEQVIRPLTGSYRVYCCSRLRLPNRKRINTFKQTAARYEKEYVEHGWEHDHDDREWPS